jgi:DNA-binding response OmpR family regulator
MKREDLVKRNDLLGEFWGTSHFFTSRSLDVFIRSLRKYLSRDPNVELKTIKGIGLSLVIHTK